MSLDFYVTETHYAGCDKCDEVTDGTSQSLPELLINMEEAGWSVALGPDVTICPACQD